MPPKPKQPAKPTQSGTNDQKKPKKTSRQPLITLDDRKPKGKWGKFYTSVYSPAKFFVIVADVLIVGWEAECLSRYYECSGGIQTFFVFVDVAVSLFLIAGLVLQVSVLGTRMLSDLLGMFEAFTVILFAVFGTFIWGFWLSAQENYANYDGLTAFLRLGRVVRILTLVKMAEDLRSFPYLSDLYLLIRGLRDSLFTLLASLVILLMIVFSFSVVVTVFIGIADSQHWSDISKRLKVEEFSTIWQSMNVLYRFVFVDDAGDVVEPIAEDNRIIWYIYVIFVLVAIILVMNLIMAVIINQALIFTKNDKEHKAKQLQKEKEHYSKKVIRFFNKIDLDGNAKLTYLEFKQAFEHQEIKNDLLAVGIEVDELRELFFILDTSNTGELAVADFVTGMQRIRGQATSRDLLMISQYARRVFKLLMSIKQKCVKPKTAEAGKDTADVKEENVLHSKLQKLEADVHQTHLNVVDMSRQVSQGTTRNAAVGRVIAPKKTGRGLTRAVSRSPTRPRGKKGG